MPSATDNVAVAPSDWTTKSGRAEELEGLWGKLRLVAAGATVGVLRVEDGEVAIEPQGSASTALQADTMATLVSLLAGELHPIVARLQGRAWIDGDPGLGLRVLLGLRAGSPWRGLRLGS